MKYPVLRLLDQHDNIQEYFLKYLPTTGEFDKQIKFNSRYERIVKTLKRSTSKADLCFLAFVSHDFEEYLTKMQSNEPMIHLTYDMMSSLLYNILKKFIALSAINTTIDGRRKPKQGSDLCSVNISKHQKMMQ